MDLNDFAYLDEEYQQRLKAMKVITDFIANQDVSSLTVRELKPGTVEVMYVGLTYLLRLEPIVSPQERRIRWKLQKYEVDAINPERITPQVGFDIDQYALTVPDPDQKRLMRLDIRRPESLSTAFLSLFEFWF